MEGIERRNHLVELLKTSNGPMPGGLLATTLGVSRQIIVQDIALLRAQGEVIEATHKGYVITKENRSTCIVEVKHNDAQALDELHAMVDNGAIVRDVFVKHKVYGVIQTPLNIRSRRDVALLLDGISKGDSSMLKDVTDDVHYHTIEAPSKAILEVVCDTLKQQGILIDVMWTKEEGND